MDAPSISPGGPDAMLARLLSQALAWAIAVQLDQPARASMTFGGYHLEIRVGVGGLPPT